MPQKSPLDSNLPFKTKAIYGLGGANENLGNHAVKVLANPVYNLLLGVNPALVGSVFGIMRLWDAFTDPLMGSISDKAQTRFGRRRPFILIGSIAMGLLFPLIWLAPVEGTETAKYAYFLVVSLVFYAGFTVFSVPYLALGYELTPDYHDRTRLMAFRTWIGALSGVALYVAYPLAESDVFSNPLHGIYVVTAAIGIMMVAVGVVPALLLREPTAVSPVKKIQQPKLVESLKLAISNRSFLILLGVLLTMVGGVNMINSLGLYVNVYHVHGGDRQAASVYFAINGIAYIISILASTPAIAYLSGKIGKRGALKVCLAIVGGVSISKWLLFTPEHPWLMVVVSLTMAPGMSGVWLLTQSMLGEICDQDELESGTRREGMFAALYGWTQKTAVSLSFIGSGLILVATGFDVALGSEQKPESLLRMRLAFSVAPFLAAVLGFYIIAKFQITEAEAIETRRQLEENKQRAT